ncbi:MAG: histidinol-phosphate transaminase [Bernardetiaceae bacterium]
MPGFSLDALVRPHLLHMKPYRSARDEFRGNGMVFLDANENNLGAVGGGPWNRYPDPLQLDLKSKVADYEGISSNQVFLGNGSDEAIDLLMRLVCTPAEDQIIVLPPTYGMYRVSANLNQIEVVEVPLRSDLSPDLEKIQASITPRTKMIFFCSPNNPTGNTIALDDIYQITQSFHGLVILDEAYQDFSGTASGVPLLKELKNLVILRTFSKAWGLAGLRLGMAFASPELIAFLTKIKPPYNISGVTQTLAIQALEQVKEKETFVHQIVTERNRLFLHLQTLSGVASVIPSQANFLLVRFDRPARPLYEGLLEAGFVVRDRSHELHCQNGLRISIGTKAENEALLLCLEKLLRH